MASTQGVEEAVATQLALIGAAIRFSDTIHVGGGGSCAAHPVFTVLSYCWPLLQDAPRRGGHAATVNGVPSQVEL